MGNKNRKVTKTEKAKAARVIKEAYPEYEVVFGAHGEYGGHRAPRDHTVAFRLRDKEGKFRSNVIWLKPDEFSKLTVALVARLVERSNGR